MLGMVYTCFADMAVDSVGMQAWNRLLAAQKLETDGAYTAGGLYPDEELLNLVVAYAGLKEVPVEFAVREFGVYLFGRLQCSHQAMLAPYKNARELILAVDKLIHREVAKLYPGSALPMFSYQSLDQNRLLLKYQSQRKLCHLAEGLIVGAGDYYNTEIAILHHQCMHRGDEACHLELSFYE